MEKINTLAIAKEKTAKGIDLTEAEKIAYKDYINTLKKYPTHYTDDAYGNLKELYDGLQNFDETQTSKDEQVLLYIKIDEVIDNSKTKGLKFDKKRNIKRRVKFLKKIKSSLTKIDEKDINKLLDAFDFELDPQKPTEKFLTENAETMIRTAISEVKVKAQNSPRTELKKGNNIHPEHNVKYFNKEGYGLFKYLVEDYAFGKSHGIATRFIYVWHFFNNKLYNNTTYKKHKYLTVDEYINFIKKNYGIKITNKDLRPSYNTKHLSILEESYGTYKELKVEKS